MAKSQQPTGNFIDKEPIMDSIYGVFKISPFEKRLLSTKEMQRLRGIKQLGFVNLVYPNAEHSRFSHSLGVCYQAKKLADLISNNLENTDRFKDWRTNFSAIQDYIVGITDVERIIISAAALLHDLPHSPFSHEIESNNDEKGIPVHDNFENNPVFFNYLFNREKSDLAGVIDTYNSDFWSLLKEDKKWGKVFKDNPPVKVNNGYIEITPLDKDRDFKKDDDDLKTTIEKTDENYPLLSLLKNSSFKKLPILGVFIFEVLLFDKPHMWAKRNKNDVIKNKEGVKVNIDFSPDKNNLLVWRPIWDWFRPYRKDIIANTICADLMDYLLRDGKNTGIVPSLDVKFLDRATIVKAFPDKDDSKTLISKNNIPDFCEHVVFDIYDHKRGFIRNSIITEIISFLQQRYLLAERVYNHRVVEGARSMLQEVSRLLTSCDELNVKILHNLQDNTEVSDIIPTSDEVFFSWVLSLNDNKPEIEKAKILVKMIQGRRIFREAVIIDGIHGVSRGSLAGSELNCTTLGNKLIDDDVKERIFDELNKVVQNYCKEKNLSYYPNPEKEQIFTLGVRPFGKRYKIPRVLVAQPINSDDIEIQPLFKCSEPQEVSDRLDSMKKAYEGLWKVYLFIHPFFHEKGNSELYEKLGEVFIQLINKETQFTWKNSINNYESLFDNIELFDIYSFLNQNVYSYHKDEPKKEESTISDISNFFKEIIKIYNKNVDTIGGKAIQLVKSDIEFMQNEFEKTDTGKKILHQKDKQKQVIEHTKMFRLKSQIAAEDRKEVIKELTNYLVKQKYNETLGFNQ